MVDLSAINLFSSFNFDTKSTAISMSEVVKLRRYAEPLITRAKVDSVANRRHVFAVLRDREIVTKLFNDIA
ncbi:MAG: hypothetical protein II669_01020, partial [Elusimicrobia bacterium]|nr:hypothetical protein [Elusimicrobiota bacterium]